MAKQKKFEISFEFFPPKTSEGLRKLYHTATQLAAFSPNYFSVTFGAGGSTRAGTLETVATLQPIGIEVAPHLSCLGLTRDELVEILRHYQRLQVKRLIILRGDRPSGMGKSYGEFNYAKELVALVRATTQNTFQVEVAAYPEVHPQAVNALGDLLNLKAKIAAGANSAITQYFFNADAYFYFVKECRAQGITVPIVPGIMPIMNFEKLTHFSALCGAEIPLWVRKRINYATSLATAQAFGLEVVTHLCEQLIHDGAPGLHFYTLNQAAPSIALLEKLQPTLRARVSS